MARDRDVAAFGERAQGYDEGWRGRMHHQISDRTADLALACVPAPRRILDVGCGTGYLLGQLAARAPQAQALAGIDAAPAMIGVARGAATDGRLRFAVGAAERLPWPTASFDLVVSTTSFDHWADQRAGLAECARVLAPGGCLVLADLFSVLLLPTLLAGRRDKARTRRRAAQLVTAAGLHAPQWHRLYSVIIQAVTATRWQPRVPEQRLAPKGISGSVTLMRAHGTASVRATRRRLPRATPPELPSFAAQIALPLSRPERRCWARRLSGHVGQRGKRQHPVIPPTGHRPESFWRRQPRP